MSKNQQEIVRLCFRGAPYDEHMLNADALEELVQFQNIMTQVAKVVWKRKNPSRSYVPRGFEDKTKFALHVIEHGSMVVPLNRLKSLSPSILNIPDETDEAISLIYSTFVAANNERPLPNDIPKEVLSYLAKLGEKLPDTAEMLFAPPNRDMTPVSQKARNRLQGMIEKFYSDELEITGRVLKADVHQRRFELWMDDGIKAPVSFTEDQEAEVIMALAKHASMQLRVRGNGEYTPDGRLKRIRNVTYLKTISDNDVNLDTNAPRIEDEIAKIFSDVSEDEWKNVPDDLSHRHDFYLYGYDKS